MDKPNTESKKMYCKYLKSFILSNKSIINNLSYQKDLKTCLKEFLLMVTSIANYIIAADGQEINYFDYQMI